MTGAKPKVRRVGKYRFYDPEPQWSAPGRWVVARRRPHQHLYELIHNGGVVGALLRFTDGWRWQTTWTPGTGSRRVRTSKTAYPTWQAAASRLARTSTGRAVCRGQSAPPAAAWTPALYVRGTPWEPKPAEPEQGDT